jgi:hypothetical protein
MKKFFVTNHAVQRFKERIQLLGIIRSNEQIKEIISNSINNCPSYINFDSYFMNEFEQSKKIPLPVSDPYGPSLQEFKVVLKKDRNNKDVYAVVTVY